VNRVANDNASLVEPLARAQAVVSTAGAAAPKARPKEPDGQASLF